MSRTTSQKVVDAYAADNLASARIIAADPDKYPGVMQTWARMVLDAHEAASAWRLTA